MELLTDGSIRCAVEICNAVPNYHIGIAFKDWESGMRYLVGGTDFALTINEATTLYGHPIRVRPGQGGTINFSNGSRLDMFVARENIRGRVYDEIFYEEGISEDFLHMPVMALDDYGFEDDITLLNRGWYPSIASWDLILNRSIKEDSCNVSESQQDLEFKFSKEEFDEFLGDALKEQDDIYDK